MATTRIPTTHPDLSSLRSLSETEDEVTPLDNGQYAVATHVRVLEDAAVYVATRMQLGFGGTCHYEDFTTGAHSVRLYVPLEAYTSTATVRLGLTASSTFTGGVGVTSETVTPTSETLDVSPSQDYTDPDQITHYAVGVQVADGDSGDLSDGLYVQVTVLVTGGTLRLWYVTAAPTPLAAGGEITL